MKPMLMRSIESTTIAEVILTWNAGFAISEDYLFLGESPDEYVYDPNLLEFYGLIEVKCPYKYHGYAPTEACLNADFFCELVTPVEQRPKISV